MVRGEDIATDFAEELFEPSCIIVATLTVSAVSFAMWHFSLKASGKKDVLTASQTSSEVVVNPATAARGDRGALSWLAALVVTSLLLLVFQLTAGFATGALTLIADSAHTAADTISYAFNWFVERAKCSAGAVQSERAQRATARFDALSAIFSCVIVLGTSACATADALHRLRNRPSVGAAPGEEDLTLIGPALLGFAVLSTAANCGLLALHRLRERSEAVTTPCTPVPAPAPLQSPTTKLEEQALADVPLPPPPPKQFGTVGGPSRGSQKLEEETLADVPLPPPPPKQFGTAGRPSRSNRDRAARRGAQIAWLHQAFHPSCNSANCSVSHAVDMPPETDESQDVTVDKPEGSSAAVDTIVGSNARDETGPKTETNLNLYGAVLHLITDVLRSLVILVVAILVQLGFIRDAPSADATCAVVVSVCIVLGSVALLRTAAGALCVRRAPLAQGLPEAV